MTGWKNGKETRVSSFDNDFLRSASLTVFLIAKFIFHFYDSVKESKQAFLKTIMERTEIERR
jgi:hypothetical protein